MWDTGRLTVFNVKAVSLVSRNVPAGLTLSAFLPSAIKTVPVHLQTFKRYLKSNSCIAFKPARL